MEQEPGLQSEDPDFLVRALEPVLVVEQGPERWDLVQLTLTNCCFVRRYKDAEIDGPGCDLVDTEDRLVDGAHTARPASIPLSPLLHLNKIILLKIF